MEIAIKLRDAGCLLILSFSLVLALSGTVQASSLSTSGSTTASYCDSSGCGLDKPGSYSGSYTGLYSGGSLLDSETGSSSCAYGCTNVISEAIVNFGVGSARAYDDLSSGPAMEGQVTLSDQADADATWSDKVTFLRSGSYTFTFNYYAIAPCTPYCPANSYNGTGTVTLGDTVIFQAQKVGSFTDFLQASAGDVISLSSTVSAGLYAYSPYIQPNESGSFDRYVQLQVFLDPSIVQGNLSRFSTTQDAGPYYTTESGFSYLTPDVGSVPEPSTWILSVFGSCLIIAVHVLKQARVSR